VVAVCVYLGGISWWELLWCFSLTGAMAMLGSAAGLRASAVCASTPRALGVRPALRRGLRLLPLTLLFIAGVGAIYAAPFLHPVYSAYWLVFGKVSSDSIWNYAWIPSTIMSYVASRYIVMGVGTLIERRVKSPRTPTIPSDTELATAVRPLSKKKERLTREVWEGDPLLWKELLTRAGSRWSSEVKSMFLVYALIFIALCWLFSRGSHLPTFAFLGALFSFLALVNGASLFAPEKEGRKIEMLLSSPISSHRDRAEQADGRPGDRRNRSGSSPSRSSRQRRSRGGPGPASSCTWR
jgi:hypothetical protein